MDSVPPPTETPTFINNVWDIAESTSIDDKSTRDFKWTEFRSVLSDVSAQSEIKIDMNNREDYFLLRDAMLEVQFTNTVNGSAMTEALDSDVSMPCGFSVFETARLELEKTEVAKIDSCGYTAAILNHASMGADYVQSMGTNEMWFPHGVHRGTGATKRWKGTFSTQAAGAASQTAATDNFAFGAHPDYPTVAGTSVASTLYWWPVYDLESPVQFEYTTGVTAAEVDAATLTGRVRANPYYEPNHVASNRRLLSATTKKMFLPLRTIFPILSEVFCKVTRGQRLELTLTKNAAVNEVFFATRGGTRTAPTFAFTLTRVSLWMPLLVPGLATRAYIEKALNAGAMQSSKYTYPSYYVKKNILNSDRTDVRFPLATQAAKLYRVYAALQLSTRKTSATEYPLLFEPLSLDFIECRINGTQYPAERYRPLENTPRLLHDLHSMAAKVGDIDSGSFVNQKNFEVGPCRIYAFDLSHSEISAWAAKNTSQIELRFSLSADPGANYDIMAITCSEAELNIDIFNNKTDVTRK